MIPIYGSMKRPENPQEGLEVLAAELIPWKGGDIEIIFESNEFTSVCPKTGQPDFNRIKIEYVPDKFYIESKVMKFYLWSFREFGIHCEYLANDVAEGLFEAVKPKKIKVTVFQNVSGGISLTASRVLMQ
mgnify:CR=1 FL=1